ncbi:MAG: PAS domain-containing protein [Cyanobacteria bacterium P01_A01_bin.83]
MNNINSSNSKTVEKHFLDCPQQQKELLDSIYHNDREAIFVIDLEADGTFGYVDMNPAGKRLMGIEEIAGKTASEIFSPSVAATVEARYEECVRSQSAVVYEECLPFKGKDTWWSTNLNPVTNQEGTIYRIFGRSIDISEQKAELRQRQEAELNLAKEKQFLQILIDNLADGVVSCDNNGVLKLFNETTRGFHGIAETPITADSWAEHYNLYYADGKTLMVKEDIPLFRALQGESVRDIKMTIIPQEGTPRNILASGDPIFDDGEQIGAMATMKDITQQEEAEAELRKERVFIKAVLDSLPVGVVACDIEGIVALFNQTSTEILGMAQEALPVEQLSEHYSLYYPDGETNLKPEDIPLVRAFAGETFINAELMAVPKNGKARNLLSNGCPLIDDDGEKIGAVITAMDFSRRKLAEDALAELCQELDIEFERQNFQSAKIDNVDNLLLIAAKKLRASNRELEQFAHVIAHDIKAPLRAIASLTQWLKEDLADKLDEDTRHNMNLIENRVLRLQNMIDDLLEYSRVGRENAQVRKVVVKQMLEDIIESLDTDCAIAIEGEMPIFVTSLSPLQQVFSNLISNAIKHSDRDNSQVKISVREQNDFYRFTVTDNGQGIDPQYHQKIFGIFQSLTSRDDKESTGIGLSIVQKAVENQDGKVEVDSQLGEGAAFSFTWKK